MTFADYEKDANHIAIEFVQYYFNKLSSDCTKLYQLYFEDAVLKHMDHKSVPFDNVYHEYHELTQIKKYWKSLTCLEQCKCVLLSITALNNNDGSIVITVAGEMLLKEDYEDEGKIVPTKAFTQTFILQHQERRDHYLLKSDILVFLPNIDYMDGELELEAKNAIKAHEKEHSQKEAAAVNGSVKSAGSITQQEVVGQSNGSTKREEVNADKEKELKKPVVPVAATTVAKSPVPAAKVVTSTPSPTPTSSASANTVASKPSQQKPVPAKKELKSATTPAPKPTTSPWALPTNNAVPKATIVVPSTSSNKTALKPQTVKASSVNATAAPTSTPVQSQTASTSASASTTQTKQLAKQPVLSVASASTPPTPVTSAASPSLTTPAASTPATAVTPATPGTADSAAKPKPKLVPASTVPSTPWSANTPWSSQLKSNNSNSVSSAAALLSKPKTVPSSASPSPQLSNTQKFTTAPSTATSVSTSTAASVETNVTGSDNSSKPKFYEVSVLFEQSLNEFNEKNDFRLKLGKGGIKNYEITYFSNKGAATLVFNNEEDQKNALEKGKVNGLVFTKKEYHERKDKRNKKKGSKNNNNGNNNGNNNNNGGNNSEGKTGGFKTTGRNNSSNGSAGTGSQNNEKKN